MNGSSRRQWMLLAGLAVAVFAYFRFGGASFSSGGDGPGDLPAIDAGGLVKLLKGVNTVEPSIVDGPAQPSDPDRNLFQYGEKRPPPPPPMTEEQRKAAEEALKEQERLAREQKEREAAQQEQVAAAQAAAAAAAAAAQPPPPVAPPQPVQPPPKQAPQINYKFVGIMGPATKKVGVFMEGDRMVLARKGEVIDGKFKVIGIGPEWADMGYVDPDFKGMQKRLDFGK